MKKKVSLDVKQSKVDLLLAALKVAESFYTANGEFLAAAKVSKLNMSLRKQIFEYDKA